MVQFPGHWDVSQIDRDYHFVCKQTDKFTDCVWGAYLHMTNACFHTTMFTFYILHVCTWNARSNKRAEYFHITDAYLHTTMRIFIRRRTFSCHNAYFHMTGAYFHMTTNIFMSQWFLCKSSAFACTCLLLQRQSPCMFSHDNVCLLLRRQTPTKHNLNENLGYLQRKETGTQKKHTWWNNWQRRRCWLIILRNSRRCRLCNNSVLQQTLQ